MPFDFVYRVKFVAWCQEDFKCFIILSRRFPLFSSLLDNTGSLPTTVSLFWVFLLMNRRWNFFSASLFPDSHFDSVSAYEHFMPSIFDVCCKDALPYVTTQYGKRPPIRPFIYWYEVRLAALDIHCALNTRRFSSLFLSLLFTASRFAFLFLPRLPLQLRRARADIGYLR